MSDPLDVVRSEAFEAPDDMPRQLFLPSANGRDIGMVAADACGVLDIGEAHRRCIILIQRSHSAWFFTALTARGARDLAATLVEFAAAVDGGRADG